MIELIESYPDRSTGRTYRTPLVLILEFSKGRVNRGRHYCDPAISNLYISEREARRAFAQ